MTYYVITWNPSSDYPCQYVVREHRIFGSEHSATERPLAVKDDLGAARQAVLGCRNTRTCVLVPREYAEDPVIVERWVVAP